MSITAQDLGRARLVWPTVATLAALAILLSLGTWQMQRKVWKEGLIDAIAQRVTAEPVPLDTAARRWSGDEDLEYLRVTARGRFRHDKERLFYAPGKDGPGFHVFTPLETSVGRYLFVNRGFVPERLADPASRVAGQHPGEVEITGLLRRPADQGWFTPANEPVRNLWFWRDLDGMAASALGRDAGKALPFFLDAQPRDPAPSPATWPRPGVTRLDLPNRHLEYALTWYGLAGALIAVYLAFARGRLRRSTGDPSRPQT
ncbi:MAG: SURF1 family protein [Hyphomicrobiaceae bacterium]